MFNFKIFSFFISQIQNRISCFLHVYCTTQKQHRALLKDNANDHQISPSRFSKVYEILSMAWSLQRKCLKRSFMLESCKLQHKVRHAARLGVNTFKACSKFPIKFKSMHSCIKLNFFLCFRNGWLV